MTRRSSAPGSSRRWRAWASRATGRRCPWPRPAGASRRLLAGSGVGRRRRAAVASRACPPVWACWLWLGCGSAPSPPAGCSPYYGCRERCSRRGCEFPAQAPIPDGLAHGELYTHSPAITVVMGLSSTLPNQAIYNTPSSTKEPS